METPLIGITGHRWEAGGEICVHPGYVIAVERAGGIPMILPLGVDPAPLAARCDGFLLSGSVADVTPTLYGRAIPEGSYSDPERDAQDAALLEHAEATGKPVFGICRGCQMMNVWRGGTLALHYRDLRPGEPVAHFTGQRDGRMAHGIQIAPHTLLARLAPGPNALVNSIHRQVCETPGRNLRVAARSDDGLIEAIEDEETPERFFAVQWHPERPVDADDPLSIALFARFTAACRRD